MLNKVVIILKSVSGAGKSSLANYLADLCYLTGDIRCEICEADKYFVDSEGNYNFNPKFISNAHQYCRDKFLEAINKKVELIVVSNTNTRAADHAYYDKIGKENGYRIIHLILENRHGSKDLHEVPENSLISQENNIKNSIKLR